MKTKIIVSSTALNKWLNSAKVGLMDCDSIIEIIISKGILSINSHKIEVEMKGDMGLFYTTSDKLYYLQTILKVIHDSPVVVIFDGDHIYLSEIYIG